MSISVTKIVNLPQAALKFLVQDEIEGLPARDYKTLGGVFSDSDYAWLSSGPRLEILHTKTGSKIGAWTFGWVLRDSNTEVFCVEEIQRPDKRLPLLAVGVDCDLSGGMICIFDCFRSKIIRAIQIKDKITSLHVIDAGNDVFTLPGPLRNFDGVIAVGTAGGEVFLVDICRQICDEALTLGGLDEIRDELNPCTLFYITSKDLGRIEHHKEFAIRNSQHIAIHLNVVFNKSTKHFTLKGPKGDDRLHVNKDEVAVSSLHYCSQLGSLLIGYNFGALQLYNLMSLELVYTSPVCDEHIPISHFAVQEPADDPRAVCYIWAIYSTDEEFPSCLPLAVMYSFCYLTKEYHEGYGCLYQDFSSASVHFQMELAIPHGYKKRAQPRGGTCLKIKSINQGCVNRENPHESNDDILTFCVFAWNIWYSNKEIDTFLAIFDLNQWYKEQMPNVPNSEYCFTYLLQLYLNEIIHSATEKNQPVLDVLINKNSIQQFIGAQRLEEHFYPNSITFAMACLRESDVVFLNNYGVQKALLAQIESSGPLSLVEPAEIYQDVIGQGLVPLFIDLPVNTPISTNQQREIILGAGLENHLIGWLCKCASEWANGSFLSAGCSLDLLINWAFQRAITLKTNCDKFCTCLFDYSEVRLDNNTNTLLNSCTRQLKILCSLYDFIVKKLTPFVSSQELLEEQFKSLQTVCMYFEVLQWLLNVGLLPECPLSVYPRSDDLDRISAPYPAEILADFYNHRRALLKILNEENFSTSESALFIDSLIEQECGGKILQEQWRNDGGNGLYPPPSLQALLRTYLIDNCELGYKHSVVIYVFLDLATTLDQERYKPVITHLIKFPAVFKVSPSVIKLTQAFWQLDHSDYNTAMGLLLDPLIAPEDLSQWHHKIVLRALFLQKQHNFALLYLQVRKPVLKDDDDILTAISLYITNNMLDEAFYFVRNFNNDSYETKYMPHLFNECKKNDKLRLIIYRTLNSKEENLFLKYLSESKDSSAVDLQVYYHILRSHFIEAFDTHERAISNPTDNRGLLGKEKAIPRDKLISCVKKLLPDVHRDLLAFCRKERNNNWLQVSRPTPMSVFVHNANENVQYKSTIIRAALSKAKQTFNDILDKKVKLNTENTPFLRTPRAAIGSKRSSAVIVNPRVVDVNLEETETSPPSAKRLKLSPRLNTSLSTSVLSKFDTPLVKRKTPKAGTEERSVSTPHSILKVKSLVNHAPAKEGDFEDDFNEFEKLEYAPVSETPKKSGLGLSPRRSLAKPSPVVRFEGLKSSSSSSLQTSSFEKSPSKLSVSPVKPDQNSSSKNTSTEDEVFYSPNNSLEDKNEKKPTEVLELNKTEEKSFSPLQSPRGRRSSKRSLGQTTPVRSSPRLSRRISAVENASESSTSQESSKEEDQSAKAEEPIDSAKSSLSIPKLRARKSLCRKVLESNTINRALATPQESPRKSKKIESTTVTTEVVLESSTKYEDGQESQKSSFISKHNLTTTFEESDSNISTDFSIQCDNSEEPVLSDSMMKYINNTFPESNKNKSEVDSSLIETNLAQSTPITNERQFTKVQETAEETQSSVAADNTENLQEKPQNKNLTFGADSIVDKSVAYSVYDTSAEISFAYDPSGPKLSESMLRCINSSDFPNEELEKNESEVMEVDDVEMVEENVKDDKADQPEYAALSNLQDEQPIESKDALEENNENEEESDSCDSEIASSGPVDAHMNVFEISDDLSFNDGMIIEREVTLEENDLCYGHQNTLEDVLEENIGTVNNIENNTNQSYESEESVEQQSEDSIEEQQPEETKPVEDDEVIEIGSSSDEEPRSKQDSSRSESPNSEEGSSEEKHDVSYERNIYDSYGSESSDSNSERRYSEISENSDDVSNNAIKEVGLFEGAIIIEEDEKKKNEQIDSNPQEESDSDSDQESDNESEEETAKIDDDQKENLEEANEDIELQSVVEAKTEDIEKDKSSVPDDSVDMDELNYSLQEEAELAKDHSAEKIEIENSHEAKMEVDQDNLDSPMKADNGRDAKQVEEEMVDVKNCDQDTKPVERDFLELPQISNQDTQVIDKDPKSIQRDFLDVSSSNQNTEPIEQDFLDFTKVLPSSNQDTPLIDQDLKLQEGDFLDKTKIPQSLDQDSKRIERDFLDVSASQSANQDSKLIERDFLDMTKEPQKSDQDAKSDQQDVLEVTTETKPTRTRTRSASVSKSVSAESRRNKRQKSEEPTEQRLTRSKVDIIEKMNLSSSKPESSEDQKPTRRLTKKPLEVLDQVKLDDTQKAARVLRSRRVSAEAPPTPTLTLRKRSASVDEIKPAPKEDEIVKPRGRRASSVMNLPKIPEEDKNENKASVLEGYSMNRRITRQQITMLKKLEGSQHDLEKLDPLVLLDRSTFEGKPDPEEEKVYDSSPSTSNSSSPVKRGRRLRSTSQASETSGRSKSKTPVRSVKSRGSKSFDESVAAESSSAQKQNTEGKARRGRPRSASSVHSEDSTASDSVKPGRRSKRVASQTPLPEIQEEPENSQKSVVPKKRTRKNSSQI